MASIIGQVDIKGGTKPEFVVVKGDLECYVELLGDHVERAQPERVALVARAVAQQASTAKELDSSVTEPIFRLKFICSILCGFCLSNQVTYNVRVSI